MLLSNIIHNGRMCLKFYDTATDKIIFQNMGEYNPVMLASSKNGKITKKDLISDTDLLLVEIPFNKNSEAFEAHVNPRYSYIYDQNLIMGAYYAVSSGGSIERIKTTPDEDAKKVLTEILSQNVGKGLPDISRYREHLRYVAESLNEPVPHLHRVAFDIEIGPTASGVFDVKYPDGEITAISFASDTEDICMIIDAGITSPKKSRTRTRDGIIDTLRYPDEKTMLEAAFQKLSEYPIWLTFYGAEFDVPYLYHRAERLGMSSQQRILKQAGAVVPINSIHIDMYKIFSNPSLHAYAFSDKYHSFGLDDVSRAMLGRGKIGHGDEAYAMSGDELASYCYVDAKLTFDLSSYSDDTVMKMLVILSRLTYLPIDTVSSTRVSTWIQSMMNMEHRREGALIPSRRDLDAKAASHGNTASAAIIGDKKYRGGLVQESQMGIFWGMTVLDFASMYPHIIQLKNISYDTLMCPHDECRGNIIHGTRYWSCTKRNGILAGAIGAIRELRVRYYKRMARETGDVMYETINGTLKVLMNASYGVMGSDYFDMYYLPVADCTTAVGRAIVTDLVDSCRLRGVEVLYGDTDSVMIKPAESGTIQDIIEESRQRHGTDLEIDKEYRYAILTGLKKNYLGVKNDGSIDIKGLTGKKSNTPVFIRHTFDYMKEKLSEVHTPDEMDGAINGITARILDDIERIRERDMLLSEMAYSTKLTKGLDEYGPSPPQHVKAALLLAEKTGIKIPSGATIRYLKTENSQHVMPYELASISQIHAAKYIENLGTVMDQVLPALGTSMERIKTGTSQDSIESFFPR